MAISEKFELKILVDLTNDEFNGHVVKLKTNTEAIFTIADSESPMSFLNDKTALRKKDKVIFKYMPPEDAARNLACYNGQFINPKKTFIIGLESGAEQYIQHQSL